MNSPELNNYPNNWINYNTIIYTDSDTDPIQDNEFILQRGRASEEELCLMLPSDQTFSVGTVIDLPGMIGSSFEIVGGAVSILESGVKSKCFRLAVKGGLVPGSYEI
jgi:hypothetical protein